LSERAINSYRDLQVWQDGMALAELCYRLARELPREELFAMASQIKRSASAIPANVAEGYGRESTQSFIQYLRIAQGSLKELETHLLLSERIGLLASKDVELAMDRCGTQEIAGFHSVVATAGNETLMPPFTIHHSPCTCRHD
jgi:four helix bundle protein